LKYFQCLFKEIPEKMARIKPAKENPLCWAVVNTSSQQPERDQNEEEPIRKSQYDAEGIGRRQL